MRKTPPPDGEVTAKRETGPIVTIGRRDTIIPIAIPQRSGPVVAADVKWSFKNIAAPDV